MDSQEERAIKAYTQALHYIIITYYNELSFWHTYNRQVLCDDQLPKSVIMGMTIKTSIIPHKYVF
jgi:hypothetical protein